MVENKITVIGSVGFDFDDVLLATFQTMAGKIQQAARLMDLQVPEIGSIEQNYDYVEVTASKLFPGIDVDCFMEAYNSVNQEYMLVPGVRESLGYLASNRKEMWIFTGKSRGAVYKRSAEAGIDLALFSLILTKESTNPYRKPDLRAFSICQEELKKSGIDPSKALYIDDAIINYQHAGIIGLRPALLLGSPNSRSYENCVDSKDVLASMYRLPEFLKRFESLRAEV